MVKGKKGDATDLPLLLIMLFFLAVSFVVALYGNTIIKSVISDTVLNESEAYPSINEAFTTINEYTTQRAFVIFFGFLCVGILIGSFLIRVHPIYLFLYIITLGVAIFVAVYLANTYELIVSNETFSAFASNYTTITFIMQHIVKILLGVGALSMIIIFGKIGGGGNSGDFG